MSAPAPSSAPTRPEEYPPAGGEHYWAKATRELRHRLAKAVPHDVLRELHRKSPARRRARSRDPVCGSLGALVPAVHSLAPDPPRRARRFRGRSEAALPLAENQQGLVQAPLLHSGALPDLFPRGAPGDRDLSARSAAADCLGAPRHDRVPPRRDGCDFPAGRLGSPGARVPRPVLPRVPDRVRVEPSRPALRDRSRRSREVGQRDPSLALVGLLVSLLRLPPRAPLLHGRPLLQPAQASLRAAPVLRLDRLAAHDLWAALQSLDLREQSSAHGLDSGRWARRVAAAASSGLSFEISRPPLAQRAPAADSRAGRLRGVFGMRGGSRPRLPQDLFQRRGVAPFPRRLSRAVVDDFAPTVEEGQRRDGAPVEAGNEPALVRRRILQVDDQEPRALAMFPVKGDEPFRLPVRVPAVGGPEEDRGRKSTRL